jgi:hypothetical protein
MFHCVHLLNCGDRVVRHSVKTGGAHGKIAAENMGRAWREAEGAGRSGHNLD